MWISLITAWLACAGRDPVPERCGAGTWGSIPTDANTLYVDASANSSGDGSRRNPYSTLFEAVYTASPGQTIAMAAGTYEDSLFLEQAQDGLHIVGRCPELVTVQSDLSHVFLGDDSTSWTLSGLTISSREGFGILQEGGHLSLQGVHVRNAALGGLTVDQGELSAVDCHLEANSIVGIWATQSTVVLEGCDIIDTRPTESNELGLAVSVEAQSTLVATDCLLQRNHQVGLLVTGGSTATLEDVRVTDTLSSVHGNAGHGIAVQDGSTLTATNCVMQGNHEAGVFVHDSTAALDGVQILDTQPNEDGTAGHGINLKQGSSLVATDCLVQGNHEVGIFVTGSNADLERVQVLDTQPDSLGEFGYGVVVQEDGRLVATATVIQNNHIVGMFLNDSETVLEDVEVLDTLPDKDGQYGYGIVLVNESSMESTNNTVQRNSGVGVWLINSAATMSGGNIRSTYRTTNSLTVRGLLVQSGFSTHIVDCADLEVADNDGPGVVVAGSGGELICTGCTLSNNAFAGAAVAAGASMVLSDVLIENTTEGSTGGGVGVWASDLGAQENGAPRLALRDSTLINNLIGAVYLLGDGSLQVIGNHLSGGPGLSVSPGWWPHGDAVFSATNEGTVSAWNEDLQSGLLLQNNTFYDSSGSAVFLDGTSATLSENTYENNEYDLYVQGCDGTDTPEGIDDEPISNIETCPHYDYLTQNLSWEVYLKEPQPAP